MALDWTSIRAPTCANTLGKIGDAIVASALARAMRSSNSMVSAACAKSLLLLGPVARSDEVIALLAGQLNDWNPWVRSSAVAALLGQGSSAEPFMPSILKAIDERSARAIVRILVASPVQVDEDNMVVPVFAALARICDESITTSADLIDVYEDVTRLMSRYPEHGPGIHAPVAVIDLQPGRWPAGTGGDVPAIVRPIRS